MSQQARKEQEGAVVRRLTAGAGAAALGLAWYFTSSAVSAVPVAFGAQPAGDQQPVVGVEQLDDHVFVRTVHVPVPRAPAGGVRAGTAGAAGVQPAGQTTVAGRTSTTGAATTVAAAATTTAAGPAPAAAQPVAQPVPAAAPPAAPKPVATTGASTPAK
jgi:hypothetical protein